MITIQPKINICYDSCAGDRGAVATTDDESLWWRGVILDRLEVKLNVPWSPSTGCLGTLGLTPLLTPSHMNTI